MTNTDGDKIAAAFMQHRSAQTPQVALMNNSVGRRLTTDGRNLESYGWWLIATWIDDSTLLAITTERYQTGTWKSGKPKYSPTTDAHIGSVQSAAYAAGFRPTGKNIKREGRTLELYER